MNNLSIASLQEVDLILFVIDGTEDFGTGDSFVIDLLKNVKTPCFLVVNKIDLIKNKQRLMANILEFQKHYEFDETYYISAKLGENVDKLLACIATKLEEGPMYYPADQHSDNPEQFIIAEIIREKILLLTHEEIPHSIAVVVEEMKFDEHNLMNIRANIFVERSSQKKIIIGKNGLMIKEIGTLARKEIVMLLGEKIFLELWVKVEEDWRNKKSQLRRMGYNMENN